MQYGRFGIGECRNIGMRKLDDDNVYRKLQGHWIIEMSEMIATANAKSIEEIKSFLSRQKEVYNCLLYTSRCV